MKGDKLSFNAQVGIGTDLLYKFRLVLLFLFVFIVNPFSAQEVKPDVKIKSNATITVVGDAFIYSKDAAFNEQISGNKNLLKNSKVEFNQNNELKISAKNTNKSTKALTSNKKKTENIVLASKKKAKAKPADLPKKDIHIHVKNLDEHNQFFKGSISGDISFIFPSNDFHLIKYFIKPSGWFGNISIKFLDYINYFYDHDNSQLQVFYNYFSVRPPPSQI